MRCLIIIISLLIGGCSSITPQKKISPADFESASQGKRIFIVGGPIGDRKKNNIYNFCNSFDQLICSKKLDKYQGKKGFIVESEPFIRDRFYFGYHVILETGEELVLKLSNVYEGRDPIEAALHLVDANKFEESEQTIGKPLVDGLSVTVQSLNLYGSLIQLILSNGETITQEALNDRIKYLIDHVEVNNRETAFQSLTKLNLRYDDFEERWWVKPKSHSRMPLYPYFGKKRESKWLRLTATYEGDEWIFFDKISIISAKSRYDNIFENYNVERDNSDGMVWEWIDILAKSKELDIINALSENRGKIRFSGKYEATRNISQSQSIEFKALLVLYEVTIP